MIKLTTAGKVVLGVALALICGLIYFLFFRPDPPPPADKQGVPLSRPAPIPEPYKFPLSASQADRWKQAAAVNRSRLTYCSFFSSYKASRAAKLDFVGIIPKDAASKSPYYYRDPETGRDYFPVFPVGAGSDGVKYALGAAKGNQQEIDPCTGGTPIVVAFPKGVNPPASGLVRVLGYMAWDFNNVKKNNSAPANTVVVNAGSVTEASLQQTLAPATRERVLNIALRRGPVAMRLSRIEFASNQTRVWVSLINSSSEPVRAFQSSQATLAERGKAPQRAGITPLEGANAIGASRQQSDLLASEDIPPVSVNSGKLEGYITFPAVNPSETLTLSLPDPYPGSGSRGPAVLLQLKPEANKAI